MITLPLPESGPGLTPEQAKDLLRRFGANKPTSGPSRPLVVELLLSLADSRWLSSCARICYYSNPGEVRWRCGYPPHARTPAPPLLASVRPGVFSVHAGRVAVCDGRSEEGSPSPLRVARGDCALGCACPPPLLSATMVGGGGLEAATVPRPGRTGASFDDRDRNHAPSRGPEAVGG